MLRAVWCPYELRFRFLARTSRESMRVKQTYFVKITDDDNPEVAGIGECALFKGLSADDVPEYEQALSEACKNVDGQNSAMSSIRFGFETALLDLAKGGRYATADNCWTRGEKPIAINGLIWMGNKAEMSHRIAEKLEQGFKVLKLKIGGINFEDEVDLLRTIRHNFGSESLELRLDANGSFNADNATKRLERLAAFDIHSIEQPVAARQHELMARLCADSPIKIALDEELIGMTTQDEKDCLLKAIRPAYIILKPSLCGGFAEADRWIDAADRLGIGWWATSALESDIGLNAIAEWVSQKDITIPQGLGTGALYENNITSPLETSEARLHYRPGREWIIPQLPWRQ